MTETNIGDDVIASDGGSDATNCDLVFRTLVRVLPDYERILLANPAISSYCTNIRLLIDENKTNYMMLAGRECMSAQTSATRPFFCQFATKIIFVV